MEETKPELSGNWRVQAYSRYPEPKAEEADLQLEAILNKQIERNKTLGYFDPQIAYTPPPDEERIKLIMDTAYELFRVKNRQYGNAIERTGLLGAVVAMTGDVSRLRQMVLRSQDHGLSQAANVRDKLIDILVQAAIGVVMLDKVNLVGKD